MIEVSQSCDSLDSWQGKRCAKADAALGSNQATAAPSISYPAESACPVQERLSRHWHQSSVLRLLIVHSERSETGFASAFHPSLAPVGVLLAVFGYGIGTYAAWICGLIMQAIAT